eukprot:5554945-Pleurochrysis_carterae.AAC.3
MESECQNQIYEGRHVRAAASELVNGIGLAERGPSQVLIQGLGACVQLVACARTRARAHASTATSERGGLRRGCGSML